MKAYDATFERIAAKALADGLPRGHYKLPFVERLAPRQRAFGPGRIFIADLSRRDVTGLVTDEKAEATLDDDRVRIEHRVASVGVLAGFEGATIHGGGETLSHTMALANYQPLTPPTHGIRVHNSDLVQFSNFLEPRLRCLQLVVLTVT